MPFKCCVNFCSQTFVHHGRYLKHLKLYHKHANWFMCCYMGCNIIVNNLDSLELHVNKHKKIFSTTTNITPTGLKNPVKCVQPMCLHHLSNSYHDLIRHIRTHHSKSTLICVVENCNTTFTSYDALRRHLKRQHGGEDVFVHQLKGKLYERFNQRFLT